VSGTPSSRSTLRKIGAFAPLLVLAVGAARLVYLVLHEPVLGYGDNFDFHRVAGWYGWLQPGSTKWAGHFEAPLTVYDVGGPRAPELLSSGLVHVELAAQVHRALVAVGLASAEQIDIRFVGASRAAVLLLVAALVTRRSMAHSRWAAGVIAGVFALLAADPISTLYANTLYADFDAVVFLFGATSALLLLYLERPFRRITLALATVSLALLGASKMQLAGLPLVLLVLAWCIGLRQRARDDRRWRFAVVALALGATAPLVVQVVGRATDGPVVRSMRAANSANTWFSAILPALKDPKHVVRELGLPEVCARNVGLSWYDPRAETRACHGIENASRLDALRYLLAEPASLLRLTSGAIEQTSPWVSEGLGQVAGRQRAYVRDLDEPALGSLAVLQRALGAQRYALWMTLALLLCAAAALAALAYPLWGKEPVESVGLGAAMAAAVVLYALVSSVFGDGYVELSKHFLLGQLAVMPATILSLMWLRRVAIRVTHLNDR
jgi:hypothetical protein